MRSWCGLGGCTGCGQPRTFVILKSIFPKGFRIQKRNSARIAQRRNFSTRVTNLSSDTLSVSCPLPCFVRSPSMMHFSSVCWYQHTCVLSFIDCKVEDSASTSGPDPGTARSSTDTILRLKLYLETVSKQKVHVLVTAFKRFVVLNPGYLHATRTIYMYRSTSSRIRRKV